MWIAVRRLDQRALPCGEDEAEAEAEAGKFARDLADAKMSDAPVLDRSRFEANEGPASMATTNHGATTIATADMKLAATGGTAGTASR